LSCILGANLGTTTLISLSNTAVQHLYTPLLFSCTKEMLRRPRDSVFIHSNTRTLSPLATNKVWPRPCEGARAQLVDPRRCLGARLKALQSPTESGCYQRHQDSAQTRLALRQRA
jgi:hypothetical protein